MVSVWKRSPDPAIKLPPQHPARSDRLPPAARPREGTRISASSDTTGRTRTRLAIAVPTYNEAASLPLLVDALERVLAEQADVDATLLVIDDNSPDGTGAVAERLASSGHAGHLTIEVLHRSGKSGLGRAYIAGLRRLLDEKRYDMVLQMDADLSHDPRHIPHMLQRAAGAQMVVGSRYVPGGATPDWTTYRKLLSRLGNRYARLFLGSRITDYTGGFNLFAVELLECLDLEGLRAEGYGFLVELKYAALQATNRVEQVPIVFVDRRVGASKIPRNTIAKNLLLVPRIRLASRPSEHNPSPLVGSARRG